MGMTRTLPLQTAGFNRTFMELKYCSLIPNLLSPHVLIVPLWN